MGEGLGVLVQLQIGQNYWLAGPVRLHLARYAHPDDTMVLYARLPVSIWCCHCSSNQWLPALCAAQSLRKRKAVGPEYAPHSSRASDARISVMFEDARVSLHCIV
jgi:hypothetical protein